VFKIFLGPVPSQSQIHRAPAAAFYTV